MRILVLAILAIGIALPAGEPAGFGYWSGADLRAAGKRLAPKMDSGKVAGDTLGKWDKHFMMVTYRAGDGESELHEKHVDIFIAEAGEATLVVGGQLVGGRSTGPGEMRGKSITGGISKKLTPGDVVHIPAKTPHQLLVKKEFTYTVFKVEQ